MFSVRLSSRDCPGHVTVALDGELDLVDASDVAVALAAASSRESLVIVDLSGLNFIDASGPLPDAADLRPLARLRSPSFGSCDCFWA